MSIRKAKINDFWQDVYKRNYNHYICEINLNGIGGFKQIDINRGIFAICGLNGAGKSTILSAVKDVLGLKLRNEEIPKINGQKANVKLISKGSPLFLCNSEGERFVDNKDDSVFIDFFDYKKSTDVLDFLGQANLLEYLEQYDEYFLTKDMLQELSYIIGRIYDKCSIIEIEEDDKIIPYFKVFSNGIEYDSLNMGMGEHNLFYLFWAINRVVNHGIILLEEPETFLNITSQERFIDYVAKKSSKLGISVILTTHSPYIIKRIPKENIRIVNRYLNKVSIINPKEDIISLQALGLNIKKKGILYVEDEVGEYFLRTILFRYCNSILLEYNIEFVNGESNISHRLKFPNSDKFEFNIIGIYDGDMRSKIVDKEINWKYTFLPGNLPLEEEFITIINNNLQKFIKMLNVSEELIISSLISLQGLNYHDWFNGLASKLCIDKNLLFDKIFSIWYRYKGNKKKVEDFIKEFNYIIY